MKKGFTLAELLIAMSIIAVISVILLPIMLRSRPNEEMLRFKKAYYLTERIVAELVQDDGLYPETNAGAQFLGNTSTVNYKNRQYSGDKKFCELFATKMNRTSALDCNFTTSDGMSWTVPPSSFAETTTHVNINIDVNGDRSPNCTYNASTCANPDKFNISVYQDGRVAVDGCIEKEYLTRKQISRDAAWETQCKSGNNPLTPTGKPPIIETPPSKLEKPIGDVVPKI